MNSKIPIKQLSEQVGRRVDVDAADAQGAIKSIFALVADVLKEGKSVTLDGLGTFTPDFNPMEPVGFTPDSDLADELNAPFAMFEPEVIADDLPTEQLEAIGTTPAGEKTEQEPEAVVPEPDHKQPTVGWAAARPVDIPEPETADNDIPVKTEPVQELPAEPSPQPLPEPPVQQQQQTSVTEPVAAPAPAPAATGTDSTPSYPAEKAKPIHIEQPVQTAQTAQAPRPALQVPEWPEEEESQETAYENTSYPERQAYGSEPDKSGRFKTGFFWGLMVGLLVGALMLFGYAMYTSFYQMV